VAVSKEPFLKSACPAGVMAAGSRRAEGRADVCPEREQGLM
jgi:hypothetical protein